LANPRCSRRHAALGLKQVWIGSEDRHHHSSSSVRHQTRLLQDTNPAAQLRQAQMGLRGEEIPSRKPRLAALTCFWSRCPRPAGLHYSSRPSETGASTLAGVGVINVVLAWRDDQWLVAPSGTHLRTSFPERL